MTDAETPPRSTEAAALLREGMAAAKSGDRERARELLTRVVKMDDRNVAAWLWLSGVVDDLNHREICLQTALKLDPQNEAVQRGLAYVHKQKVDDLLRTGIDAAQRGQRDHARSLLLRVVEMDEKNLTAWLWLTDLVTSLEDRETALENALSLDPGNEAALRRLEQVREQMVLERETQAEMAPRFEEVPKQDPATITADLDWERPPPADEFDNALLCPFCATLTAFKDKRCSACGGGLVLKTRVREERSSLLWIAITLQLGQVVSNVATLFFAFVALAVVLQQQGLAASPTVGVAFRFLWQPPAELPAELSALLTPLRLAFIGDAVVAVLSVVVLAGLYMRWRPFWYLYMGNAGLGLIVAVAAMFLSGSPICGGLAVLLAIGMVFLAFQLQDDFSFRYSRILLQPDRSARSALDYLSHARQYARQGMWALAIVHYQRAAGIMTDQLEPHLGLALALIKVQRYDRAAVALAEARQISPDNPHVAELEAMLPG
jgi:tetratricopeptide (TPR) repeat protein